MTIKHYFACGNTAKGLISLSDSAFEELEKAGKLVTQFHLILSDKGKKVINLTSEKIEHTDSEDW